MLIQDMPLSVRARNVLIREGALKAKDVEKINLGELWRARHCGKATIKEIKRGS
jgi:DNA-directed RNA polymerase alpha subunit